MAGPKATRKHKFVKAWIDEHVNDHWVKEATRLGYRSRAAFKLIEIDDKYHLLKPGQRVVVATDVTAALKAQTPNPTDARPI